MSEIKETHEHDQERFKLAVNVLLQLDFSRFLRRMENSADFGCFTNPTEWMAKVDDLKIDIEATRAIQDCIGKLRKIYRVKEMLPSPSAGGERR